MVVISGSFFEHENSEEKPGSMMLKPVQVFFKDSSLLLSGLELSDDES